MSSHVARRIRSIALVLLVGAMGGCTTSATPSATPTPTPQITARPTAKPRPTRAVSRRSTPRPQKSPSPKPISLYVQEHVGAGLYQLLNTLTYQFEEVAAGRIRTICRGGRTACTTYLSIDVTAYSGNARAVVGPGQFLLISRGGARIAPATMRQARPIVDQYTIFRKTALQPDDDGDYATGVLVFLVPPRSDRFSLNWQGRHVATFVKTARGKLTETK